MYNIRPYQESDYENLVRWSHAQGEPAPTKDLIPTDSTFVLEVDNTPIISLAAFMPNVKGLAYFENFIGNPAQKELRKEYGPIIMAYVENFLKEKGYIRVVCFAHNEKVAKRYEELGMKRTLNNLSSFVKEIK